MNKLKRLTTAIVSSSLMFGVVSCATAQGQSVVAIQTAPVVVLPAETTGSSDSSVNQPVKIAPPSESLETPVLEKPKVQIAQAPVSLEPPVKQLSTASKELRERLTQLPFFTARFEQRVVDFDGSELQKGEGDIALKVPNQFRWHQQIPDESLLMSDGSGVYFYEPLLEQVSIYDSSEALTQTPLALLTNDSDDAWGQYQVTRQQDCFKLVPNQVSTVAEMTVCFVGDNPQVTIDTLQFVDSQGLTTSIALKAFSTDLQKAPSFKFEAPEGTFVDDQRSVQVAPLSQ